MIKINLLQEARSKRRTSSEVQGEKNLLIGLGILAVAAACVWAFIHRPLSNDIEKQTQINNALTAENDKIEKRTQDFDQRKKELEASIKQGESIELLNGARATPAWLMWELSQILTPGKEPSLTPDMKQELEDNENLRWQSSWDPKHVWITSFTEKKGTFTLTGAAQSDGDVTQLAHRLGASMFFESVMPQSTHLKSSSASGVNFYEFMINGKVRY